MPLTYSETFLELHFGHHGTKCLLVMVDRREDNSNQLLVRLLLSLVLRIRTRATLWMYSIVLFSLRSD